MNYQNIQTGAIITPIDLNRITIGRSEWQQTDKEATHRTETVVLPINEVVTFRSQPPSAAPIDFPGFTEEKQKEHIPGTSVELHDGMLITDHEGE